MSIMFVRTTALPHLSPRTITVIMLAIATVVLTAVGAATPWLSLFNGLTTIPGLALDGGYLAILSSVGISALFVMSTRGGGRVLRVLAGTCGAAVLVDSVLSATRIGDYVARPGSAATLTAPTAGPGAWIMASSGIALICTAIVAPAARERLRRTTVLRGFLAMALIVAAGIHIMLSPQHFSENPLLGVGFLVAGVAQLSLAIVVLSRDDDRMFGTILTITVALIAIYAYAVLIGLPLDSGHSQDAVGFRLGAGEPVDLKGLLNILAEAVVIPLIILARRSTASDGTETTDILD